MYCLTDKQSSLIKEIYYDETIEELTIVFKTYYVDYLVYSNVPQKMFDNFVQQSSLGKFYLQVIKPNYKIKTDTMATENKRPETLNPFTNSQKEFIKMSINVTEINKDWLFVGEKGAVYANITLAVNPDGKVDKYGNLGMVTQDVPKKVYEAEKNLPADKKSKGAILGNGAVLKRAIHEGTPGVESGTMGASDNDDLPF